ncbi:DUF1769-domain-containing protein [Irpex rosettiformis]|uniref:DUF1769-domain-containing protein n=1 Tax=Irpex rosettiformis TaxID=378272 RepID=A0ACB8TZ71_9APHY|nr:DUF1769-domain-containing protein [Irpex rosettiformis]
MPRLRVLAGASLTNLKEIKANTGEGIDVSSDVFEGKVAVYIKDFVDARGTVQTSAYFEHEERKDVTWSIQFQGRFLKAYSANDILFGNVFDKPLPIPWGFSTILGFMKYVDPTLEQDLQSQSMPWALSPLISTMTYLAHSTASDSQESTSFPPKSPIRDDTSTLPFQGSVRPPELPADTPGTADERRAFFKIVEHRELVTFGPNDLIIADFCYNFLLFSPCGVQLKLPGGFSLDMMRFWDGRPVNFVCGARRSQDSPDQSPLGEVFFCLAIEVLRDDKEDEEEDEAALTDDVD